MTPTATRNELTRNVLAVLFLLGLILGSLWVMVSFVSAIIWATMIVISTWPILCAVQRRLWNKRKLAVAVMTLALLLLLFVPLSLALGTVILNSDVLVGWAKSLTTFELPPPPAWLAQVPLVGEKATEAWQNFDRSQLSQIGREVAPYVAVGLRWFVSEIGSIGLLLVQFLLTVVVCAIMYSSGEVAAMGVRKFARRLAGDHGDEVVQLAARAVRAVALGVVVTATVQSVLAGIGLWAAGVPFAALLTGVTFLLCIAQLGPLLVLLPAVAWVFWQGHSTAGSILVVWSILVLALDNVLRPVLIRRGANLPLLLIFAGVIGGLISFGLVGIFTGPVILAVTYTLLKAWVGQDDPQPAAVAPAAAPPAAPPTTKPATV